MIQILARLLLGLSLLLGATLAVAVVEIDQPAPPLRGTLVSGDKFDLADYRGKVVLVNFYSSYCRFCALEIGTLETFHDDLKDRGFEVIVIGVDALEDKGRVARMLGIYNLQGAMADELDETGFERRYPTPTAYLIDRDGIVRSKTTGPKTTSRMRELLGPYLGN